MIQLSRKDHTRTAAEDCTKYIFYDKWTLYVIKAINSFIEK